MPVPRATLALRFGAELLQRLDQAEGRLHEPLRPVREAKVPGARMTFAEPVSGDSLAAALRPLAPVHLRAVRGDDGVTVRWIRRARHDADTWSGEIPLAEESERYTLDILSGDGNASEPVRPR